MKTLPTSFAVIACSFGFFAGGFAAELPARAPAPPATPARTEKVPGESKPLPMYSRADIIDTKARIFITKRKDGKEVKPPT